MIQETITFLNNRITGLDYFQDVFGLAERIEREEKVYPAIYNQNEYSQINLDSKGSLTYWRRTGDTTYSEQENTTIIGREYITTIPLRLVGFMKKTAGLNDGYFSERIVNELIGVLTTNSVSLKQTLLAKKVNISANKYMIDGRVLAKEEYEKIDFEPRYDWAYFAIDFSVVIVSNQNCYLPIC